MYKVFQYGCETEQVHLLNELISTSTLVQHITGLFEIETEEEISKQEFQEHEDTQTIR